MTGTTSQYPTPLIFLTIVNDKNAPYAVTPPIHVDRMYQNSPEFIRLAISELNRIETTGVTHLDITGIVLPGGELVLFEEPGTEYMSPAHFNLP